MEAGAHSLWREVVGVWLSKNSQKGDVGWGGTPNASDAEVHSKNGMVIMELWDSQAVRREDLYWGRIGNKIGQHGFRLSSKLKFTRRQDTKTDGMCITCQES